MRYPSRPFDQLDDLPDGPGVYIVWSLISGWEGRPLYVGMTKRTVEERMAEHVRNGDGAVPLFPGMARVEFRETDSVSAAYELETYLRRKLRPYY